MSLRYFVHVSSVSNLSDARYCSGMMVDSLGYNLDENSESRISYKTANEISKGLMVLSLLPNLITQAMNILIMFSITVFLMLLR